jgi:hypothetical protein
MKISVGFPTVCGWILLAAVTLTSPLLAAHEVERGSSNWTTSAEFGAMGFELPMERAAQPCECFPSNLMTKNYLEFKSLWPWGKWAKYTCEFSCTNPSGSISVLTGTMTDSYRMTDDGSSFLCRGVITVFRETPMSSERQGVYMPDRIRPFTAMQSGIPELEAWASQNCK